MAKEKDEHPLAKLDLTKKLTEEDLTKTKRELERKTKKNIYEPNLPDAVIEREGEAYIPFIGQGPDLHLGPAWMFYRY